MNATWIGSLALDSLLQEIDLSPKPGLVSPLDSGSHTDMDAALLRRSANTLQPYFIELARAGAEREPLEGLQRIGLEAEAAMMNATGGVNTHRGALFGMGLMCAAAGVVSTDPRAPRTLGEIVSRRWGAGIRSELHRTHTESHGSVVRHRYGTGGARAEAAAGFPTLYRVGWPALRHGRRIARGDERAARVHCLFSLIAALTDTNLLYRAGLPGLRFAQDVARAFVSRGAVAQPSWVSEAGEAHRLFVSRNLSPGGSADLLALTVFVDAWQGRAASFEPQRVAVAELV
jgi:triphosphoribosyl-dephospho-CoA synthase